MCMQLDMLRACYMTRVCTFWTVVLLFCVCELSLFWGEQNNQDCSQVAVLFTSSERSPWRNCTGGIAVETAEDWDSGFGTKLWRWAEDIPREWVISLWSHSHHLWVDVEALPSTVLLVIRQRINTAMSGKSDTSLCNSNFILKYWHPLPLHPGGMESLIIKSKCDGT